MPSKYSLLYCSFLLLMASCNGQTETENQHKTETSPIESNAKSAENKPINFDPYFAETEGIKSKYGPTYITRNILQDRKGDFWFATFQGLIHYDGIIFTNYTKEKNIKPYRVFSLLEDKKGNIWFGTVGVGVYRYDGENFTNFTSSDGLADGKIECILEDDKGNIWLGTGKGISRYDGTKFQNYQLEENEIANDVHDLIQTKKGEIWAGTGGGVYVFDGTGFSNFQKEKGTDFVNVRTIIEDKKENLWFGGNDGLWKYDGNELTQILPKFTGYIFEDSKGQIWISKASGNDYSVMKLYRSIQNSLPVMQENTQFEEVSEKNGMVFGIMEDKEGAIWFGDLDGVCRYDGAVFNYFKEGEN